MTRAVWLSACATTVLLVLMHILPLNKLGGGYIEQQWLVDYSSGFIRRGLFGELWFLLAIPTPYLYTLFDAAVTVNYLLCASVLFAFCFHRHNLSPAAMLVVLASPILWAAISKLNGRFDIIFNCIFIVLLLTRPRPLAFYCALLLTPLLGLIHELWLILYAPMLAAFFFTQGMRYQAAMLVAAAISFCALLMTLTAQPPGNITALCAHIKGGLADMGINTACTRENVETSLQSLHQALANSLFGQHGLHFPHTFINAAEFVATIAYITLAALPILYVLHAHYMLSKNGKLYATAGLMLAFLLCTIALDWGRFYVISLQLVLMGAAIGGYLHLRTTPKPISRRGWLLCFLACAAFIKLPMSRIILPL